MPDGTAGVSAGVDEVAHADGRLLRSQEIGGVRTLLGRREATALERANDDPSLRRHSLG